jgi:hypothetical protein
MNSGTAAQFRPSRVSSALASRIRGKWLQCSRLTTKAGANLPRRDGSIAKLSRQKAAVSGRVERVRVQAVTRQASREALSSVDAPEQEALRSAAVVLVAHPGPHRPSERDAERMLANVVPMIQDSMEEVRRSAMDPHPSILDDRKRCADTLVDSEHLPVLSSARGHSWTVQDVLKNVLKNSDRCGARSWWGRSGGAVGARTRRRGSSNNLFGQAPRLPISRIATASAEPCSTTGVVRRAAHQSLLLP